MIDNELIFAVCLIGFALIPFIIGGIITLIDYIKELQKAKAERIAKQIEEQRNFQRSLVADIKDIVVTVCCNRCKEVEGEKEWK